MFSKKHIYLFILVALVCLLAPIDLEAQCAMCKASVESSQGQKNSVAAGINKGILYLMGIPYLLLMFIFRKQIVALWKSLRNKNNTDSVAD